jgi:hypothetical protein
MIKYLIKDLITNIKLIKQYGSTTYFFSRKYRKEKHELWKKEKKLSKRQMSILKFQSAGVIGIILMALYSLGIIIYGVFFLE